MSSKLLSLLLLVITVALYMLVISPVYSGEGNIWAPSSGISNLKSLNKQYTSTLVQIDTIERGAEALYKDYTNLNPEVLSKMNILLSDSVDQVKLRNEVVTIASRSGLALEELEVKKERLPYKGLDVYLVTFSLKARYPVFKRFITDIDKNMRFYNLESIILERQPERETEDQRSSLTDKDILNIQVKFRVYQIK
mgnify:FL=1